MVTLLNGHDLPLRHLKQSIGKIVEPHPANNKIDTPQAKIKFCLGQGKETGSIHSTWAKGEGSNVVATIALSSTIIVIACLHKGSPHIILDILSPRVLVESKCELYLISFYFGLELARSG